MRMFVGVRGGVSSRRSSTSGRSPSNAGQLSPPPVLEGLPASASQTPPILAGSSRREVCLFPEAAYWSLLLPSPAGLGPQQLLVRSVSQCAEKLLALCRACRTVFVKPIGGTRSSKASGPTRSTSRSWRAVRLFFVPVGRLANHTVTDACLVFRVTTCLLC